MYINNVFTKEQIDSIQKQLDTIEPVLDEIHGRTLFHGFKLDMDARTAISDIVKDMFGDELELTGSSVTEYNLLYGTPELNPHFDGDDTKLIVDYQLSSNIDWPLGLDQNVYTLKDNQALCFDPNETIHWRPRSSFQDGDYVRMIFFRFYNPNKLIMRDDRRLSQSDVIFDDVKAYRDSL